MQNQPRTPILIPFRHMAGTPGFLIYGFFVHGFFSTWLLAARPDLPPSPPVGGCGRSCLTDRVYPPERIVLNAEIGTAQIASGGSPFLFHSLCEARATSLSSGCSPGRITGLSRRGGGDSLLFFWCCEHQKSSRAAWCGAGSPLAL
jgi:hypothetical protein